MAEPHKTSPRPGKKHRCAIYTRKSTDEGLEQAFNSLDAQREACSAYIQSQKHEGWTVVPTLYDDGGYSGGTMERPALKRLLADIEAGQVDVVVVYKVDRLTRALSDFAKLVDVFDDRSVSFVSITQQFSTTTSMGRLTLNVLLSFAQFEREVIGERVRDKIAASKKKGMWMGGTPPLGFDVKDRKLVVNDEEAKTVRHIFRRYLALRSVRALKDELAGAGIKSKRRLRPDGTLYGDQTLAGGALYLMLQNRIYRGETTHKGSAYPGEHRAIVDQPLWDRVQAVLAENRVERTTGAYAKQPSLLTGLVFDETGERLTPTHAVKKGTRYRYYISRSLMTGTRKGRSTAWRIPAGSLEGLVLGRLREFLTSEGEILDAIRDASDGEIGRKPLVERAREIAEELASHAPHEIKPLLISLLDRVEIKTHAVELHVSRHRLANLLARHPTDPSQQDKKRYVASEDVVMLKVAARLQRAGREMRMVVQKSDDQRPPDPSLLRIVARAHDIQTRLFQNPALSVHDIARSEKVTAAYIYSILRLPWLAPDITAAIVNGRQPLQLNAMRLVRLSAHLPVDWMEQRKLLGFG
jgi:site-specific DNA recombinase